MYIDASSENSLPDFSMMFPGLLLTDQRNKLISFSDKSFPNTTLVAFISSVAYIKIKHHSISNQTKSGI